MIKDGAVVNILLKFIKKSIDINNKLYKRAIKKRYNKKKIGYLEFYKNGNVFKKITEIIRYKENNILI